MTSPRSSAILAARVGDSGRFVMSRLVACGFCTQTVTTGIGPTPDIIAESGDQLEEALPVLRSKIIEFLPKHDTGNILDKDGGVYKLLDRMRDKEYIPTYGLVDMKSTPI